MAPRQGCSAFSPGVEEGRRPDEDPGIDHRRKIPPDPARALLVIESTRRERHPCGVVSIMMINHSPGSSALRASTPGLKDDDPSGAPPLRDRTARHISGVLVMVTARGINALSGSVGGVAPLVGARSIGIGHPRSGDRCTAPIPFPLDPARASPSGDPPSRRPARGRGLLGMAIHRSSALRASTYAYGTGILRMPIVLSELSIFGQNFRLVRLARLARLAGCTPCGCSLHRHRSSA